MLKTGADFDGETYEADLDKVRLTGQLKRVHDAMANGRWWTLEELSEKTGDNVASISARMRDLRKAKFGGMTIERQRSKINSGLFYYRLKSNAQP